MGQRPMPTGSITKRAVDSLQPGAQPIILWDDDLSGFGVKVTPAGKRTYVYQYRIGGRGGRTVRTTIGSHGAWTPDKAREEAKRLRRETESGTDPVQARRDAKAAELARADAEREAAERRADVERAAEMLRIDALVDRFLTQPRNPNKPRSARTTQFYENILRLHVVPIIGDVQLPNLSPDAADKVLDALPAGSSALRRNTFATMRALVGWAIKKRLIEANPLFGMDAPSAVASRKRVLTDVELALVWRAAETENAPVRALHHLLLLTGQRREEVAALDWRELDRDAAEWSLPGKRSKNGEGHMIPLSGLAIAELDALAGGTRWPKKGLALTTTGSTPISGYSKAKRQLDVKMLKLARADAAERGDDPDEQELTPWVLHDLRRTLATGLQRLGIRFEVTESVLNHVSGSKGGVAGIYQRHSWAHEKRAALDAWASHVAKLLDPAAADETNVVSIGKAA